MTEKHLQALLLASIAAALVFIGVQLGVLADAIRTPAPRLEQAQVAQARRGEPGEVPAVPKRSVGAGGQLDPARVTPAADDPVDGSPQAPVSMISFMDLECPYCAKFFPAARKVVAGSGGRINFRFRHFPIESHPNAMKLGVAAECLRQAAGDAAFFALVGKVYAAGRIDDPEAWLRAALAQANADAEAVQACRDAGDTQARLEALARQGSEIGVSATPTTVLYDAASGRTKVVMGFRTLENFEREIAEFRQ